MEVRIATLSENTANYGFLAEWWLRHPCPVKVWSDLLLHLGRRYRCNLT